MSTDQAAINKTKDEIDNYRDTVFAIIAFGNFYRLDAKHKSRPNVRVSQGRRLDASAPKGTLTPDVAVLLDDNNAVVAEVKRSFPADEKYWQADFEQLKSYDQELVGWPSVDEKAKRHEIALLLHQSRAAKVRSYFEQNKEKFPFERNFAIVEFNRSHERRPYFFLRTFHGELQFGGVNERLQEGVQVPMDLNVAEYSTVKLYDTEPPLPYLLELIWTYVVLPAASKQAQFTQLRKRQKMDVPVFVDDIVKTLHEGFSFKAVDSSPSRCPRVPDRDWIRRACNELVRLKEAVWVDAAKTALKVSFRKFDDSILEHFINRCLERTEADNSHLQASLPLPEPSAQASQAASPVSTPAPKSKPAKPTIPALERGHKKKSKGGKPKPTKPKAEKV